MSLMKRPIDLKNNGVNLCASAPREDVFPVGALPSHLSPGEVEPDDHQGGAAEASQQLLRSVWLWGRVRVS